MKTKASCFIIILVLTTQLFSGCAGIKDSKKKDTNAYYRVSNKEFDEGMKNTKEAFVTAFKDMDIIKLEDEFSDYVRKECDVKGELEKAKKFIDGNIMTIGSVTCYNGGGSTDELGDKRVNFDVQALDIKTDTGKTYDIYVYGIFYLRDEPEKKGVHYIHIESKDDKKDAVDVEDPDTNYYIGMKM